MLDACVSLCGFEWWCAVVVNGNLTQCHLHSTTNHSLAMQRVTRVVLVLFFSIALEYQAVPIVPDQNQTQINVSLSTEHLTPAPLNTPSPEGFNFWAVLLIFVSVLILSIPCLSLIIIAISLVTFVLSLILFLNLWLFDWLLISSVYNMRGGESSLKSNKKKTSASVKASRENQRLLGVGIYAQPKLELVSVLKYIKSGNTIITLLDELSVTRETHKMPNFSTDSKEMNPEQGAEIFDIKQLFKS